MPYAKNKYVWEMLYIFMLGCDVDFGHMEAVSLIFVPKYPEKLVHNTNIFVSKYSKKKLFVKVN